MNLMFFFLKFAIWPRLPPQLGTKYTLFEVMQYHLQVQRVLISFHAFFFFQVILQPLLLRTEITGFSLIYWILIIYYFFHIYIFIWEITTDFFQKQVNKQSWKIIKHGFDFLTIDSVITFENFVFIFVHTNWLLLITV